MHELSLCLSLSLRAFKNSERSKIITDVFMNITLMHKHCHALQDTIQTFYDITHREVETLELKTSAKDREMELMEDNHR